MILWFRHLPQISMDLSEWTPFIRNNWIRKHYMKFVYLLQITFFLTPNWFGVEFSNISKFSHLKELPLILIIVFVFILHEILHILVINSKGDISLTFSGIFFG
ncbi:hypothetical protein QFZ77_004558 [Paenibacillus sp. V4I3]|nr:hypothetical protein [Paenibacillus sp. V4I3]MDQ0888038.1 hypothetical protein [Paenibacillus sp. V4I9]